MREEEEQVQKVGVYGTSRLTPDGKSGWKWRVSVRRGGGSLKGYEKRGWCWESAGT